MPDILHCYKEGKMKAGDLIRWNKGDGRVGLFLGLKTFDKKTNPYTCALVLWSTTGSVGTIQTNLVDVINESM